MAVGMVDRKMLWGRSGGRCAICGVTLANITDLGHSSIIGEEAHIVAKEEDGPRGKSPLDGPRRDEYSNLILLCPTHHTEIDKVPSGVESYPVERLVEIKRAHEEKILSSGQLDEAGQRAAEQWAYLIDQLNARMGWPDWMDSTASLFRADGPALFETVHERLHEASKWIFSRVWPPTLSHLRETIETLNYVLMDLLQTFELHADPVERAQNKYYRTERFYKIQEWNPDLYSQLLEEYKDHVSLVRDLSFELTRYSNFVADIVRREIDPTFRFEEGVFTVWASDVFNWRMFRPEFSEEELTAGQPYKGPDQFRAVRTARIPRALKDD